MTVYCELLYSRNAILSLVHIMYLHKVITGARYMKHAHIHVCNVPVIIALNLGVRYDAIPSKNVVIQLAYRHHSPGSYPGRVFEGFD